MAQFSEDAAHHQLPQRHGFEHEYPFASHFVEIDGHHYHYIDEGEGETLLMVHGNPTWSFAWRNLIKAFSADYRVLAIDHLGCGFSDKPQNYPYDLAHHIANLSYFFEKLDLERVTLFAHDWGGAIGMGVAGQHPDRFARFVLFNTAAFRSKRIPLRIALCRLPFLGTCAVRGFNAFSRCALTMAVTKPERMTPAVKAGYLAPYDSWRNRVAVSRFIQDIPLSERHPSYETLTAVESGLEQFQKHPVLFVWGERDWCFTTEFLREFQQRFPKAETFPIADAGHYVFEDAQERMIPRIHQFLEAHPLV